MSPMPTEPDTAWLRLLQLCSVNLPVGGFAFSQGLEAAVEQGWVTDLAQTRVWLHQQLRGGIARLDLPLLLRQQTDARAAHWRGFAERNEELLASRETRELHLTDTATGNALVRLLRNLEVTLPPESSGDYSFVSAFALAAAHWGIEPSRACTGYAWVWLENQVMAAAKLVPLGQTQAQQLLGELQPALLACCELASGLEEADIGNSLPALAIVSSWHETQYSRLFRS